ncbi:WD40-repeat-containing domain protein [Mycena epipterygia]|nr:WD40-repeat-containing domain protein [Mycena epipterygia]
MASPLPSLPSIKTKGQRLKEIFKRFIPCIQSSSRNASASTPAKLAWHGFKTIAKDAEAFVDGTPFKIPIAILNKLIETADAVIDNKESVAEVLLPIGERLKIVVKELTQKRPLEEIEPTCQRFADALKGALTDLEEMRDQGLFKRILELSEDPKKIQEIVRRIDEAQKNFELELNLTAFRQTKAIKDDTEVIRLNNLRPSQAVRYGKIQRDSCVKGTREQILEDIVSWCKNTAPNSPAVYWLRGMAGTGKSTIAYTICKQLAADGEASRLGASFFCSRQIEAGRKRENILPTLSHELALALPKFRRTLLDSTVDANSPLLENHFDTFLIRPWDASISDHQDLPPLVVVLDALDELENEEGSDFLKELLDKIEKHRDHLHGLKFFVTSRLDPGIVEVGQTMPSEAVCHLETATAVATHDIKLYFCESLPDLDHDLLSLLTQQAAGLFIYAATAIRFIIPARERRRKPSVDVQKRRLQILLQKTGPDESDRGPEGLGVDHLYEDILEEYFHPMSSTDKAFAVSVLHTILCAQESMFISDIADFLTGPKMGTQDVENVILALHSVLYIESGRVYSYHKSFSDFIFNPSRFVDKNLAKISSPTSAVQVRLADCCFQLMHSLRFNICDLPSSFIDDSEIADLPLRINQNISSSLAYACRHWAEHLSKIDTGDPTTTDPITALFWEWLDGRFLFWIETMNLLNVMRECSLALTTAHRWLGTDITSERTTDLRAVENLVAVFGGSNAISKATPHLYLSALSAASQDSTLMARWCTKFPGIPTVTARLRTTGALVSLQHNSEVHSVCFHPDGLRVISGSRDHTLHIWEVSTGRQLHLLTGHTDWVFSVGFSGDGLHAISGSSDQTVRIWEVETGQQLHQLVGHDDWVRSVGLSRDGLHAISGSDDETVRIWEVSTGQELHCLTGHDAKVNSVCFSHDELYAISGSDDSTVRVWDVSSVQQLHRLEHDSAVSSVNYWRGGSRIISCSERRVYIWDISTGQQLIQLDGYVEVTSVALSHDGLYAIAGSYDRSVRVWKVSTGKKLFELAGHEGWVNSVDFSPDGLRVLSGSDDHTMRIWDVSPGQQHVELDGHGDSVSSVCFSTMDNQLRAISSSDDGTVRIWDIATGHQLQVLEPDHLPIRGLASASRDGLQIISGGDDDDSMCLYKVSTENPHWKLHQLHQLDGRTSDVTSVGFSYDALRVISGSSDGTMYVWEVSTGQQLRRLVGHTNAVYSVSLSQDGLHAISGSEDKTVRIWEISTGEELRQLKYDDMVYCVSFSPDTVHAISGCSQTVHIWEVLTGQELRRLDGHMYSASFSHDGLRVVTASRENVRIWEVSTGQQLLQLDGHEAPVRSVGFSPDGQHIISGSYDRTVRIWTPPEPGTTNTEWYVAADGWITSGNQRLFWLRRDLLRFLHSPQCLVISSDGSVKVELANACFGEKWMNCYDPNVL